MTRRVGEKEQPRLGGLTSTNLLSRQQIHSADGDAFGDACTATIFRGRVTVEGTGGGFPAVGAG